jgi:hypothetical protein
MIPTNASGCKAPTAPGKCQRQTEPLHSLLHTSLVGCGQSVEWWERFGWDSKLPSYCEKVCTCFLVPGASAAAAGIAGTHAHVWTSLRMQRLGRRQPGSASWQKKQASSSVTDRRNKKLVVSPCFNFGRPPAWLLRPSWQTRSIIPHSWIRDRYLRCWEPVSCVHINFLRGVYESTKFIK